MAVGLLSINDINDDVVIPINQNAMQILKKNMVIFSNCQINVMYSEKLLFFVFFALSSFLAGNRTFAQIDSWTHFRGDQLNGIARVQNVPVKWNDSNINWKTEIHDMGWSSPVVYNDQIWLTTASDDGKKMYATCLDLFNGEIVFDILVFEPDSLFYKHNINSYATPSPCIEDGYVYVHFGRYGTACLNSKSGDIIWQRTDIQFEDVQGPGSSLLLYKDKLILHCEGIDRQSIIALNKSNGETLWEAERPADIYSFLEPIGKKAYITPIIVNINGKDQLISNGSAVCISYDPDTGNEIWRVVGGIDSTISSPFSENGIVYFYTGYKKDPDGERYAELLAVDPTGKGNITDSHVKWKIRTPILQLLTPVIKDGLIYTVDTKNTMMCIEAKTGSLIWSERVKGKFNSSPIYADGKIFFPSLQGEVIVIREGKVREILAVNKLEGEIWATPVILDGSILVRTSKYLYKIGS